MVRESLFLPRFIRFRPVVLRAAKPSQEKMPPPPSSPLAETGPAEGKVRKPNTATAPSPIPVRVLGAARKLQARANWPGRREMSEVRPRHVVPAIRVPAPAVSPDEPRRHDRSAPLCASLGPRSGFSLASPRAQPVIVRARSMQTSRSRSGPGDYALSPFEPHVNATTTGTWSR